MSDLNTHSKPEADGMAARFPTAYSILFGLIIVVAALTWIIPAGQYDRAMNEEVGREIGLEMVQDVLHDVLRASERRVSIEEIQKRGQARDLVGLGPHQRPIVRDHREVKPAHQPQYHDQHRRAGAWLRAQTSVEQHPKEHQRKDEQHNCHVIRQSGQHDLGGDQKIKDQDHRKGEDQIG